MPGARRCHIAPGRPREWHAASGAAALIVYGPDRTGRSCRVSVHWPQGARTNASPRGAVRCGGVRTHGDGCVRLGVRRVPRPRGSGVFGRVAAQEVIACRPAARIDPWGLNDITPGAISSGMMAGARGAPIAHFQDQALRAFRRSRGDRRPCVVRGRGARREGLGRCRSRRWRHQATHRSAGTGPLRRVPRTRVVSPWRTGVLRPRVREERSGEPAAQGTHGVADLRRRDVRAGRPRLGGDAGEWDDQRGELRWPSGTEARCWRRCTRPRSA